MKLILQFDKMTSPQRHNFKKLSTVSKNSGDVLLRVSGLTQSFGGQQILRDIALELSAGEVVLLQGANGSGKTTLLNILSGNLEPDKGSIELTIHKHAEYFYFPQGWWQRLNPWNHFTPEQVAQQGVARTWQDIRLFKNQSLLNNITVAKPKQKGENPFWALIKRDDVRQQEKKIYQDSMVMLSQLGLAGRDKSSADRVSLGQSKRVAIARAMQAGAKILFLDEPLAGLDKSGIADVMAYLTELTQNYGVTLVIVEHFFNIPYILKLTSTIWTLQDGQLLREDVESSSHYAQAKKADVEQGIHVWLRSMVQENRKNIEKFPLADGAMLSIVSPENIELGDVLLEVNNLVVYRGRRLVIGKIDEQGQITGLSFSIRRGQIGVLEAPNGWGKTTLIESISGILPVHIGCIRVRGKPVQELHSWERFRVGLSTLQTKDNIFSNLSVREVLRLSNVKTSHKQLDNLLDKMTVDLSGGERQKVALATVLNSHTSHMVMLDEPFSALDQSSIDLIQASILEILKLKGFLIAIPISA